MAIFLVKRRKNCIFWQKLAIYEQKSTSTANIYIEGKKFTLLERRKL